MIVREIDWRSPLDAFAPLTAEPFAILLHAGDEARAPGWSTIAAFPAARLEARGLTAFLDSEEVAAPPFEALRALWDNRPRRPQRSFPGMPAAPLMTGLCGFVGYEMGAALEPSAKGPESPFALAGMAVGAYDACALFHRQTARAFICSHTEEAAERLEHALGRTAAPSPALPGFSPVRSNFSRAEFEAAVAATVQLIRNGAIFQANIAQQLLLETVDELSPFDLFRRAAAGDAPFGAFLNFEEGAIISNSPERFFRIEAGEAGRRIIAEPIKGTRPRSADANRDRALAAELVADPKERAENIMIADLTRNDLSRITKDGSIREEAICALESFSHVHHLVSRISGELRDDVSPVDALAALFPCGSITGAPKIEAMKTIAGVEGVGRGPYCGAIGYIDDRGTADFSVAIRTMIAERRGASARITLPVGGGITLRSDPASEYEETLYKARASLAALGIGTPR